MTDDQFSALNRRFDGMDQKLEKLREDTYLIKALLGLADIDIKTLRPAIFSDPKH